MKRSAKRVSRFANLRVSKTTLADKRKDTKNDMKQNKKNTVKAVKTVNAQVETVKAVQIALDCANRHNLRLSAQKLGCDLMLTHATKKASVGYVKTCVDFAAKLDASAKADTTRDQVVAVNGVARTVRMLDGGFYVSQNDGLSVVGNVDLLGKLYGKQVVTIKVSELAGLHDKGAKVTLKKGARTFDNAVVVATRDNGSGDCAFVVRDGDKYFVHNGEFGRNCHNGKERIAQLKG
jgi:hypothetical protein